jgi:hypothetical protein
MTITYCPALCLVPSFYSSINSMTKDVNNDLQNDLLGLGLKPSVMSKIQHLPVIVIILSFPATTIAQQLTVTPQVGIQSSNTKIGFNNSPYTAPYRTEVPYLGARFVYESKRGHGPYLNFSMGTNTNTYQVSSPSSPYLGSFSLARTDLFRIEGGYQWNTKPLYFKRIWNNNISAEEFARMEKKGWHVRFQPFIGVGYNLRNGTPYEHYMIDHGTVTTYSSSGNFVLSSGLMLEFGKNDKRKFSLSFNYVAGLNGGQSTIIDRTINGVNYQTHLYNRSSGFNVTLGVPLTLFGKKERKYKKP